MEEITITLSPQDFWKLREAGFKDRLGIYTLKVEPTGEAYKYHSNTDLLIFRWVSLHGWLDTEQHLSLDDIWFKDEKRQRAWIRKVNKLRVKLPLVYYEKYIAALRKTKVVGLDKLLLFIALKELPKLLEELPRVGNQVINFNFYEEVYAERLFDLIKDVNPTISNRKIYHCIGLIFYISGIGYEYCGRITWGYAPFSQDNVNSVYNPFSPQYDYNKLVNRITRIFTNQSKKYY